MLAAVMPLPNDDVTPPVTKTYFATDFLVLWLVFPMLPNHAPRREPPASEVVCIQTSALARQRVYDRCMGKVRTNIRLEDEYVRTIMERYQLETKTEAVDLALRHLAGLPMTREEALGMHGAHAIGTIPEDVAPRARVAAPHAQG
jgi:Arc/MetJ family transcription regulator